MAGAGGSWNLPGGSWNLLGALGTAGRCPGSFRDAPGSSTRRGERQMDPRRLPKKLPKSTIFGVGRERCEKVEIALPSRRQCNFRGSGTFDIELFWSFWGVQNQCRKWDSPKMAQNWLPQLLGKAQGRKWVPPGSPKDAPGEPKGLPNPVKIEVFSPVPRGRFQDLSPGAPRGPFREHI